MLNIEMTNEILMQLMVGYYSFAALSQGGVDNWEYYGDAMGNFIAAYNDTHNTEFEYIVDIVNYEITGGNTIYADEQREDREPNCEAEEQSCGECEAD